VGPKSCPETSVRNYHHTLRNIAEARRFYLLRGGSLKSRIGGGYEVMTLKLGVGVSDSLTVVLCNSVLTDTRLRTERRENRNRNPVKSKVLFLPLYHPDDFVGPRSSLLSR
jgi:hypothetical protein